MIHGKVLLVAGLAMAAAMVTAGAAEPVQVRVLTYNIHHGEGTDGRIDLARIAAVIKRLKPDLVALQEVDVATRRSGSVDQASELARLTGMHSAFGKAMDYAGGQYGQAILSVAPLRDVVTHPLPTRDGCEPRCALAARVRLGKKGFELMLVATHLEHAKATVRLCQAQKLAAAAVSSHPLPSILAGDFNARPNRPTIHVLLKRWADATAQRPEPTWPADQPRRKLDYVFFRPVGPWRVVQTVVVAERVASDHRPLLVALEWIPPEGG